MEQVTGSRGADDAVDERKRKSEVEKKFLPFVLRLTKPWALAWSCDWSFAGRVFSRKKRLHPRASFYTDEEQRERKRHPGKKLRSSWYFFFLSWLFLYMRMGC